MGRAGAGGPGRQRSLTLREVLKPVEISDGVRTYRVEPATFITTMLSVTNTTVAPSLAGYDPSHYRGRKLTVELPAKELVSTVGHKWHTCPAWRFSITGGCGTSRSVASPAPPTP